MSRPALSRPLAGLLLAAALGQGWAQVAQPSGIYTCTDAKGRKLTSDRPIVECMDREQKELNASGTVRRTLGPSLTATERAAREERERKVAEERQRQADERRAQKALLNRYPNQAAHDAERAKALQQAGEVVAAGHRHLAELNEQRRRLAQETEFYRTPASWPDRLRRQVEDTDGQIAAQQRFIAAQEQERTRIERRFDEELARLKVLWAQAVPAGAAVPTAAGPGGVPAAPTRR